MNLNTIADVAIIGAGPVGMYTAFYCGLRKISTILFDSLEYMGGQVSSLYPEKHIHDLPGFPEIKANDFIERLAIQVNSVDAFVTQQLGTTILDMEQLPDKTFNIITSKGSYHVKAVILAIGNGAFEARKLGVPAEDTFDNLHYFITDLSKFSNQSVTIFGGGDSAVDWALMLEKIAKSVTIVHRRDEFRAKETATEKLRNSSVNILTPFTVQKLIGTGNIATAIELNHNKTKETLRIETDKIIANYGVVSTLGFLKDWKLTLTKNKILTNRQQETSIPGVFACGDVCDYPGREVQIATGLGEGLIASAAVHKYIYPDSKARPIR